MEAHAASADLLTKQTRMEFGWGLAKFAWRLSRRDRVLLGLGFPASFLLAGAGVVNLTLTSPDRGGSLLLLVPLLLGLMLAGMFLETALTFAADAAIDGQRLGWRDALAEARWRLGAVLAWAAIAAAVGLALAILIRVDRLGFVASLPAWLWSFATVFVVPMLALDLANPVEALREVPDLLRRRWGEELAGSFGIGAILLLAAIPGGILIGAGISHNHADPGSGTLPVLLGTLLLAIAFGLGSTTLQTFAVALYRDATTGFPDPSAFVERRPKRKSWVVRIGAAILAVLVVVGLVGSIVGPKPGPKEFHTRFPARYSVAISAGMPVVYRGIPVGEVKRAEISDGEDVAWFTVESQYRSLQSSSSVSLSLYAGRPCLAIVRRGEAPPESSGSEPAPLGPA